MKIVGWFNRLNARQAFLVCQAAMAGLAIGALGVYRLSEGAMLHGAFDLGLVAAIVVMARIAVIDKYLNIASRIAALLYVGGVWAVVNIAGEPALYWALVAVLATFFAIRANEAALISTIAFLLVVNSVFDDLAVAVKIGFSACFWLTALFSYYFSARLWSDNEKLEREAHLDRLTGLLNRRSYDDAIARTLIGLEQHSADYSLLLIDIDYFKRINDEFGHAVGDLALARAADVVRNNLPDDVKLFRFGGEEFVALVPASLENTRLLAERLREAMEQRTLIRKLDRPVTISVGIAAFRADDDSRSWFQRADNALYQAKESGRNRVVTASD